MEVLRKYATQGTIYFPLVDAGATDFESTPVTFASGDTQVSIDGGAFANTTNNPAHEGNGIYSLVLTAAELTGAKIVVTIIDSATKAWEDQAVLINTDFTGQQEANQGIVVLEVDNATLTPSSTIFECLRIWPNATEETTADHYLNRNVLFTSGNLTGIMTDVQDYALTNSKERLTVTATPTSEAPADGDRLVVL